MLSRCTDSTPEFADTRADVPARLPARQERRGGTARVMVQQPPLYLYVPPGHAKDWGKHCYRYNACGRPVYFVQENWVRERYEERHGHGNGRGHGKGKGNKHND